jgi:protein-tyrosine-phosphatase
MRTILFICTGNTCRSPMAEAVAQHWLDRGVVAGEERFLAASAGTAAKEGGRPAAEALRSLREMKIGLHGRSKRLTADMIRNAELVFGMTEGHVETARSLVEGDAGARAKIRRLDPAEDIEDPIGMGQEAYDLLLERLMVLIPQRLKETLSHEDRAGIRSPGD